MRAVRGGEGPRLGSFQNLSIRRGGVPEIIDKEDLVSARPDRDIDVTFSIEGVPVSIATAGRQQAVLPALDSLVKRVAGFQADHAARTVPRGTTTGPPSPGLGNRGIRRYRPVHSLDELGRPFSGSATNRRKALPLAERILFFQNLLPPRPPRRQDRRRRDPHLHLNSICDTSPGTGERKNRAQACARGYTEGDQLRALVAERQSLLSDAIHP